MKNEKIIFKIINWLILHGGCGLHCKHRIQQTSNRNLKYILLYTRKHICAIAILIFLKADMIKASDIRIIGVGVTDQISERELVDLVTNEKTIFKIQTDFIIRSRRCNQYIINKFQQAHAIETQNTVHI